MYPRMQVCSPDCCVVRAGTLVTCVFSLLLDKLNLFGNNTLSWRWGCLASGRWLRRPKAEYVQCCEKAAGIQSVRGFQKCHDADCACRRITQTLYSALTKLSLPPWRELTTCSRADTKLVTSPFKSTQQKKLRYSMHTHDFLVAKGGRVYDSSRRFLPTRGNHAPTPLARCYCRPDSKTRTG